MKNKILSFFKEKILNRVHNFIDRNKLVLYVLISFLIACSLTIKLDKSSMFHRSFNSDTNNFMFFFIGTFGLFYLTSNVTNKLDKRGKIISVILAIIYALFDVVGYTYNTYKESIFEALYLTKVFIRFSGFLFLANKVVQLSFYAIKNKLFDQIKFNSNNDNKGIVNKIKNTEFVKKFSNSFMNSKSFRIIIITLFFTLCYLPYFLQFYPGCASFDGQWQMAYVDGILALSNHHPVFHTLFIALFMKISNFIGGDNNLAIALYCFTQMVLNAFIFSFAIEYIRKTNLPKSIRALCLLIFAFVPIFPINAITLWKDTSFALVFLVFTMLSSRVLFEGDEFLRKKRNIVFLILAIIFVNHLRNNGIYIMALSFPFFAYAFRKHLKPVCFCFITAFVFYLTWNFYIHNVLNARHTEFTEALSVPVQAMARAYAVNSTNLSKEERESIKEFIPSKSIKKDYNPINSDSIRYASSDEYIKEHFNEFIGLYFKLLKNYPKIIIDSFIDGCYGYFYPNITYWRCSVGIDTKTNEDTSFHFYDTLGIESDPIIKTKTIDYLANIVNDGDVAPFFNMFFSIGLWFELVLFLIGYNAFNYQGKKNFLFLPILFLFLTCMFSPVFGEHRYVYAMFTSMPIFLAITFFESDKSADCIIQKDTKTTEDMKEIHESAESNCVNESTNTLNADANNTKLNEKTNIRFSFLNEFLCKILSFFKRNKNKLYLIAVSLLALYMIFYICYGCKTYINSDSSFIVDYAEEQIRTNQFFPTNWVHGNDFWIYSLIPLIYLFLKIGMKIFMARQLSVIVQSILLILVLKHLFNKEINYKAGGKIALLLILSGVSGMFAFEVFGDATYGTIIFFMLLLVLFFVKILNDSSSHKKLLLATFGVILSLITACSLRFPIYVGAPLLCVLAYFIYNDKFKKKYVALGAVIVISTLVGLIGHNALKNNLIFENQYDERGIVNNYSKLITNISGVIFDYLTMCGSTSINTKALTITGYNDEINPSSPFIVATFVKFAFAIATFLIPILLLRHLNKMNVAEKSICIFTTSLMCIVLFFQIVGNMSNWYRYVTPVVFFMILLYPLAYKYLFSDAINKKYVFKIFIIASVISSLYFVTTAMFSLNFLFNVEDTTIVASNESSKKPLIELKENPYQKVIDFLLSKGYQFGYCSGGQEHNLYNTLSDGKIRVASLNNSGNGPRRWLNSLDWYQPSFYKGKVFFIKKTSQTKFAIEEKSTESYKIGNFTVYEYSSNDEFLKELNILNQKARKQ